MKINCRLSLWLVLLFFHISIFAKPSGSVVGWGFLTCLPASTAIKLGCTSNAIPIASDVLTNVVAVSTGNFHLLALKGDGTVVEWGPEEGKNSNAEPIHRLRTNGLVVVEGSVLTNVVSIADGLRGLALKRDGTVVAWGNNTVPSGLSNITAIAGCDYMNMAVKSDGTVFQWSRNRTEAAHAVPSWSNVISVVSGSIPNVSRNVALKADGTVAIWGDHSSDGNEIPPPGLSNVVAVAAGAVHSLALKKDGTVVGWGWGETGDLVKVNGQVLSNVVAIAARESYSLALKNDGSVVGWGQLPAPVPEGLTNVIAIAAGPSFCLAITTNSVVADKFRQK